MVSGTIILFEEINDGIRNRIQYIRKLVALYFRFSLLDPSFHIFLNGSQITLDELTDLINGTQFLWKINNPNDPYISEKLQISEALKKQKIYKPGLMLFLVSSLLSKGRLCLKSESRRKK